MSALRDVTEKEGELKTEKTEREREKVVEILRWELQNKSGYSFTDSSLFVDIENALLPPLIK